MSSFAAMLGGLDEKFQAIHATEMLLRMTCAVAVGALLAARPWRLLLRQPLPRVEMIQAQLLLCTASAVIIAVIGDSVAKAFSLVCLGGFVRFKTGLKDPRDAATLFIVLGLGMACGHGNLLLALVGTLFVSTLLFAMDAFATRAHPRRIKLSAISEDPAKAEESLRKALRSRNIVVRNCSLDFDTRKVELDVEEREPGSLASALKAAQAPPLRELKWTDLPPA